MSTAAYVCMYVYVQYNIYDITLCLCLCRCCLLRSLGKMDLTWAAPNLRSAVPSHPIFPSLPFARLIGWWPRLIHHDWMGGWVTLLFSFLCWVSRTQYSDSIMMMMAVWACGTDPPSPAHPRFSLPFYECIIHHSPCCFFGVVSCNLCLCVCSPPYTQIVIRMKAMDGLWYLGNTCLWSPLLLRLLFDYLPFDWKI